MKMTLVCFDIGLGPIYSYTSDLMKSDWRLKLKYRMCIIMRDVGLYV